MVYDEHLHNGARNSVAKLAAPQGNNYVRRADKTWVGSMPQVQDFHGIFRRKCDAQSW